MAISLSRNSVHNLHPETLAVHVDDELHMSNDVAPPLHVSCTFKFPSDPEALVPLRNRTVSDTIVINPLRAVLLSPETRAYNPIPGRG